MKKTIFIALNEFNEDLLRDAAEKLHLKNLETLLSFHKSETYTDDTYESDFLEPWVQWVSVHTGLPSEKHQIKHLGDVPHLSNPQIWEELSKKDISSGIWGAMNANRGSAKHCRFFLPDPWTASEVAYPDDLNQLLSPLRYFGKNYLAKSPQNTRREVKSLLSFLRSHKIGRRILGKSFSFARHLLQFRGKHFPFICFFDYVSALLFLEYVKKESPDFSFIFINSLAHLQHHHWKSLDILKNKPLIYGLKNIDEILKNIFFSMEKDTRFVVTNALSQKNTNQDKPWILYRQIDQADFLRKIGISFSHVEPHMTHDAHIFFQKEEDCKRAKKLLESAEILGKKLFLMEAYDEDPLKLFYRICFTDKVPESTKIVLEGKNYDFFSLFKAIVQRTGKHIQKGTLFCNESLSREMKNHEIFSHLY